MTALAEKLVKEALALTGDDRAGMVDVLLRSLTSTGEEIDRLWAEEAERRVREVEDGTVTLLDGHGVLEEIRQRLDP